MDEKLLGIQGFDPGMLQPTYYYFRLGAFINLWDNDKKDFVPLSEIGEPGRESVKIPGGGYALIRPFELFTCSEKVLAIFGQRSTIQKRGLRLNHSPSIDPGFPGVVGGVLEMGLENLLNIPIELKFKEIIGKVMFFDISDTYPIKDIKGTISEREYIRRRNLTYAEPLGFSSPNRI